MSSHRLPDLHKKGCQNDSPKNDSPQCLLIKQLGSFHSHEVQLGFFITQSKILHITKQQWRQNRCKTLNSQRTCYISPSWGKLWGTYVGRNCPCYDKTYSWRGMDTLYTKLSLGEGIRWSPVVSPYKELCFDVFFAGSAVNERVNLPVFWDKSPHMWHQCNVTTLYL